LQIIIQQAYDAHRGQASVKEQALILELSEEPLFVWGDAVELHEAAANFISNAIKYTPENGRIVVNVERSGSNAVFEVRDNGYGIPEDQQAQLFQPFYRADTKETQEIDGTGLGLHLVKNIVERHKGQIRFKSQRGEGSTFGFHLPIVTQVMSNESSRLA
jgi:signal transduction histidine kinase